MVPIGIATCATDFPFRAPKPVSVRFVAQAASDTAVVWSICGASAESLNGIGNFGLVRDFGGV